MSGLPLLQRFSASVHPGAALAAAAVAACGGGLAALILSPRAQSILVFVQHLNWPPFDHNDPTKPSARWIRLITGVASRLLGEAFELRLTGFKGLATAEPFSVKGPNGTLRGFRLPRAAPGRKTVLYFHGNGGNIALRHRVELYERLAAPPLCCDVYTVDYVGFGHSDGGWPDEASAASDALAALDALRVDMKDVVVFGHSLGSGIALAALEKLLRRGGPLPKQLVLESPFTSVPDVPAGLCSWLPATWHRWATARLHSVLAAHRFPSFERIGPLAERLRVDILHGRRDVVVPFEHGQRLATMAGAQLHCFHARGHDDIVRDPMIVPVLEEILGRD